MLILNEKYKSRIKFINLLELIKLDSIWVLNYWQFMNSNTNILILEAS